MYTLKLIICILLLVFGMFTFISATIGVGRFKVSLMRMHSAAMGDTLALFAVLLALIIWKGANLASLKMAVVLIFFWFASPVCSHIIAQLEAMTNEELGEITIISDKVDQGELSNISDREDQEELTGISKEKEIANINTKNTNPEATGK